MLVPDPPVIDVRERLHVIPVLGEIASVRETVFVKLFAGPIVIVDVCAELTFPIRLVGLAVIVKSWIVNVAVAVCESVPLVPVIVSL